MNGWTGARSRVLDFALDMLFTSQDTSWYSANISDDLFDEGGVSRPK